MQVEQPEKRYFSFIGSVNCVPTQDHGLNEIHQVGGDNWNISIYDTANPAVVIIVDHQWSRDDEYIQRYKALRCSFDCNPMVPVSTFAEQLKEALA